MSSPRRTRSTKQPTTPPSRGNGHKYSDKAPSQPDNDSPASTPSQRHDARPHEYAYNIPIGNEKDTSFSPSKARAQARATHQITVLKTWLADLLKRDGDAQANTKANTRTHTNEATKPQHTLITRWENEYLTLQQQPPSNHPTLASEILKAMQDLMYANQAADSHRRILHEARREELARLRASALTNTTRTTSTPDNPDPAVDPSQAQSLLTELDTALGQQAEASLTSLAEVAVQLGVDVTITPGPSLVELLSGSLMHHTSEVLDLSTTITSVRILIATLEGQLASAKAGLASLEEVVAETDRQAEMLQAQTSRWQREARQITLKIQEYGDRISMLTRTRPGAAGKDVVLVEDVIDLQERVRNRRKAVSDLENRVKLFHGLPADLEASRHEVKRARDELVKLKRRREALFEGMVD